MSILTIGDRKLVHFTQGHGPFNNGKTTQDDITLEDVRDYLIKLNRAQQPHDTTRPLQFLAVDFLGQRMKARWLGARVKEEQGVFRVTSTAASQLAREVLPSRFFHGLKKLALLSTNGEKQAAMDWNEFASFAEKDALVRTVRMKVDGEIHRVIRSCHSATYAPYANLRFVQDLIDNGGEFAQMPILDWYLSDNYMRLRFLVQADDIKNGQVQMVEIWNSETGCRRVGLRGGVFFPSTGAGFTHWEDSKEKSWYHSGDSNRISQRVQAAFEEVVKISAEVLNEYRRAQQIEIDNAYEWMLAELEGRLTERAMTAATGALLSKDVTEGGKLASVVDAVLIAAQSEDSLETMFDVERAAANALHHGTKEAKAVHNEDDDSLTWMIEAA